MNRKTPATAAISATVAGVLLAGCCLLASAASVTPYEPLRASFAPVVVPTPTPSPSESPSRPSLRPEKAVRVPHPTTRPKRETPRPVRADSSVSGLATYYCCTRGYGSGAYVAAAGPALRIGDWRGRRVRVCSGGRCITVTLVDWCACGRRHGEPTVIDLHPGAFSALAPLSRGVIWVTVEF